MARKYFKPEQIIKHLREAEIFLGKGDSLAQVEEACSRPIIRQRNTERSKQGKLLSPARKRKAVKHVIKRVNVSERRACKVLGQPVSTQRHIAKNTKL
jgi:putative transposase